MACAVAGAARRRTQMAKGSALSRPWEMAFVRSSALRARHGGLLSHVYFASFFFQI